MSTEVIPAIIGSIGGAIAGFDLMRVIFFKSSKRKASAEATSVEKQNEGTAVDSLIRAISTIKDQLDYANRQNALKDERINELQAEKNHYIARLQALYDDMCVHKGCKLRVPHQGQGEAWYEAHRGDAGLGCDFLSVETLLKQWRARNADISAQ